MRYRAMCLLVLAALLGVAGLVTFSGSRAQDPVPPRPLPSDLLKQPDAEKGVRPVAATNATNLPAKGKAPIERFRDFNQLPIVTKQMFLSAQRGMECLSRFNQANGRFLHGYLPAVNQVMEGDHFLRQAMATFALARSARFTGDEKHAVRAGHAILSLMAETRVDPATPGMRVPMAPSVICNRLGAAGFMVMAICELPDADADLIAKGEELCQFIRVQQKPDGSLHYTDTATEDATKVDPDGINLYPGPALYGIALSQRLKPATWKTELLRKAGGYYQAWFKSKPHPAFVPWMTAAFSEAHAQTKAPGFATIVCEMCDWLCKLQYEHLDPRHPEWRGGFQGFVDGKPVQAPPTVESALYAQCLADACRMIRHMTVPEPERYERYRTAMIRGLQFVTTLQYAEDNTQHFVPSFRAGLVGGFHPSQQDGNLRVDQTAWAVSALVQYLTSGAEKE